MSYPTLQTRRRDSVFLHIRPKSYPAPTIAFTNTFYLGFLSTFFLVLECITGIILMVYYVPTPDDAYASILRLNSEIPFGWLVRDLHRLGGELMIISVVLHMLRVFLSGSYKNESALTWITGIILLICTLFLAFSGYLLPWDQLAYWAVTIGTSLADAIPWIGKYLTLFLRGGVEFGQDGLLRFYLLHIIGLPFFLLIFLAIHYYRIVRIHGISLPVKFTISKENTHKNSLPQKRLFPDIILVEILISLVLLTIMVLLAAYFYDAPLENHADPEHTPLHTQAPWFFLWLQGGLKFGNTFIMGICFPALLLIILLCLPFSDKSARRPLKQRPLACFAVVSFTVYLITASTFGLPNFGTKRHPIASVIQDFSPDEELTEHQRTTFSDLPNGLYQFIPNSKDHNNPLLDDLSTALYKISQNQKFNAISGMLIVQDWQDNLTRLIIRIRWQEQDSPGTPQSMENTIFLHRTSALPATTDESNQI